MVDDMDQFPVELHLLRSLKGPALSVLIALWIKRTPQNMRWLQRTTGYGDEAVQGALEVLAEYSLVTRNGRYAWQISAHGKQLPLAMQSLPEDAGEKIDPGKTGVPFVNGGEIVGTPENPESDHGKTGVPCSSSSRLIDLDNSTEKELLPRANDSVRPEKTGAAGAPELLSILDEYGVREPARSRLAALPYANRRLFLYHLRTVDKTGQAIHRIEANWRVPRDWDGDREQSIPQQPELMLDADPAELPGQEDAAEIFDQAMNRLQACMKNGHADWTGQLSLGGIRGSAVTVVSSDDMAVAAARSNPGWLISALSEAFGRPVTVTIRLVTQ
jgi:hypothetical protein